MPPRARPLPEDLGDSFSVREAMDAGVSERRLRHTDLESPFRGVRARATLSTRVTTEARWDESPSTVAARHYRADMLMRVRAYALVQPSHAFFRGVAAAVIFDLPLPLRCVNADAAERLRRGQPMRLDLDPPRTLDTGVFPPHRASRSVGVSGRQLSPTLTSVQVHEGLRVVSPATMWAQLAEELTVDELIVLGDALVHRPREGAWSLRKAPGFTTVERLDAAIRAGRRVGSGKLRQALPHIRTGSASPPETELRLALIREGLPEPSLDFVVVGANEQTIGFTELAYPAYRVLIEYEGDHHRLDRAQWNRDIDKHAQAVAAGWVVLRITSEHMHPSPRAAVTQIRDALLRAGWHP